DGDVHATVGVEVARREGGSDGGRPLGSPDERSPVSELGRRPGGTPHVVQDLNRLRVPLEIRDRYPAVGEHEVGMAVQVEVDPGSAPAGKRLAERRRERRSNVLE